MKLVIKCAMILVAMGLAAMHAVAGELRDVAYVNSTEGNDNADGGSFSNPFRTLQYAVDHVAAHGTVVVAPGTYEAVAITNVPVSMVAVGAPSNTIIDARWCHSSAIYIGGEARNSTINGISIVNGDGDLLGDSYWRHGGGVCCTVSANVKNCVIRDNGSMYDARGGGLYVGGSNTVVQVENCLVYGNIAYCGGAVYVDQWNQWEGEWTPPRLIVRESTIVDNSNYMPSPIEDPFSVVGGVFVSPGSDVEINDSIIWDNDGFQVSGPYDNASAYVSISLSCVMNGLEEVHVDNLHDDGGNITSDPCFVSAWEHNYELADYSPCISRYNDGEVETVTRMGFSESRYVVAREGDPNLFRYELTEDGEAVITNISRKVSGDIVLPSIIEGHYVIGIGSEGNWRPVFECFTNVTSVVVPEGYRFIGECAFAPGIDYHGSERNVALRDVSLPSSLRHIGSYAFSGCISLDNIVIPEGVTNIWSGTFQNCSSLKKVTIPSTVRDVNSSAFLGCLIAYFRVDDDNPNFCSDIAGFLYDKQRKRLIRAGGGGDEWRMSHYLWGSSNGWRLPETLEIIGEYAFGGYKSMYGTYFEIPAAVTNVHNLAFWDCEWLYVTVSGENQYYIADGREAILTKDGGTLVNWHGNDHYMVPLSVTNIGYIAFGGNRRLLSVTISDTVRVVSQHAFTWCEGLTEVTLPKRVEMLDWAFAHCGGLRRVVMQEDSDLKYLYDGCFQYCTNLTEVVLTEGLEELGRSVFWHCTALKELTIPETVVMFSSGTISECYALTNLCFRGRPIGVNGSSWLEGYRPLNQNLVGYYRPKYAAEWKSVLDEEGKWHGIPMYEKAMPNKVTFVLGEHGQRVGGGELVQQVLDETAAVPPEVRTETGWRLVGWDKPFDCVETNLTVKAIYSHTVEEPNQDRHGSENTSSYVGVYDGLGHGLSVAVTSPTEGVVIRYALSSEGPFQDASILFTNACASASVWYEISAEGYVSVTNWATVTISPAPLTVTAGNRTIPFGTAAADGGVSYQGLVNGEQESVLGGALSYTYGTYAVGSPVGSYPIEPSGLTSANYAISYVSGTLTVVTREIGDDDDPERSDPENPLSADALSKFDATFVYDGDGHTIDTNAMVTAFGNAIIGEFAVHYGRADSVQPRTAGDFVGSAEPEVWLEEPPMFTNAGEHVVWYRVSSPNYSNYVHQVKVTITKRSVTLMSDSASKVFDGAALTKHSYEVGGSGFVDGEGVVCSFTGSQTHVGTGKNTFTYQFKSGTRAENYVITTTEGDLVVTKADAAPGDIVVTPVDSVSADGKGNVWTFDGDGHGIAVVVTKPEDGVLTYAATAAGPFTETMPLYRDVVQTSIWYRVTCNDYNPVEGSATLQIVPRPVTEDMLTYSDEAYFFDGDNTKVPDVVLAHTNRLGEVVNRKDDYVRTYGARLPSGEYPVTITGLNNYTGSVTKAFKVIKRPVAPPVIPSKSYNGRTQKPTVPTDERWTLVSNPGGIDAGFYTNVVLRLTNTTDYKWKGYAEDGPDTWTGVFEIRQGANGWSTYPSIKSWTNGVNVASVPVGKARNGTVSVAYRVRGTAVETETATKPTKPGKYIARFWVEPTKNYAGYALTAHYEVEFEIFADPNASATGDETTTTPVPVPHEWIDPYLAEFGNGDYEKAGNAMGRNGVNLWVSYVAGLDPTDPESKFMANISLDEDGRPVVTCSPDLSNDAVPRIYTILGKAQLDDAKWVPVTDQNKLKMRFFKVRVELGQ